MESPNPKPSEKLMALISQFATSMGTAGELANQILKQAEEEKIPKDQIRKLVEDVLKQRGLADRTIIKALPPQLKNQNMIRKNRVQKKGPLVTKWSIKFNIPEMWNALKPLYEAKHTKGEIIHDNKRVLEVLYE